ncbi:hypothetical protein KGA66_10130 [Actinocrinis puniceicyclus]|uniref:Uncharacterized protein n=1 Tax=Actinocrinis puniceicyclus TaxID=977794 RepID=A0A8J7WP44_9ACTN|nr:hypothetical protein [Actinocrinis puniceicyclus]MBS2963404.1 hypothetical protein [Actinocrinis puniceicyclus]
MTVDEAESEAVCGAPEGTSGPAPGVERRRLLTAAGGSLVSVAGALASCSVAAEAVFNPATVNWLAQLGSAVAASLVEDALKVGLTDAWKSWTKNVNDRVDEQNDFPYYYASVWLHAVPPTVLVKLSKGTQSDPMSDCLLACVDGGQQAIRFDAWAWQTLMMFVHELTGGKSGDDLSGFQALCLISLIPSGPPKAGQSPSGKVGWMSYQARNGSVEIDRQTEPDGSVVGVITATGIPAADGKPTSKKYTLPAQAA